jgi:putative transposase
LQERLGFSERRACRLAGQHRSTQRHVGPVVEDDAVLRAELRAFSRERPRWGYRQAHQRLLEHGWSINRKRTQRLWREEGLRVPPKRRKRQRRGESTVPGDRLRAERPDHVWAFDFQWDVTEDGRAIKLLYVVDEFTREALAMVAERSIDADKVVDILDRIIAEQVRRPALLRCDNGPEMTSHALRDWCRFSRTGAAFIEPGSPWENPFVESFNSRVRDELLAVESFSCLTEAKVRVCPIKCVWSLVTNQGDCVARPSETRSPEGRAALTVRARSSGREHHEQHDEEAGPVRSGGWRSVRAA